MGTLGTTKTWVPYMNPRECTQQICSLSCPQLCYMIFTPPPPLNFPDDNSQTSSNISPLVIAIIGILVSAFLLVSYYAIISKYCGKSESSRREENYGANEEIIEEDQGNRNHEPFEHEPWYITTHGLDEALIKNITLVQYKKDDGLIESTDCAVCLGEFLEDDNLRLLPKCSHAFHVPCIDTWLKSHSNCPLCRANIVYNFVQPVHSTPPPLLVNQINITSNDRAQEFVSLSLNMVCNEEISTSGEGSRSTRKSPFRTISDLGGQRLREDTHVRRSFSMDHSHERQVSISDVLRHELGEECQFENCESHDQAPKSRGYGESSSKSRFDHTSSSNSSRIGVLHTVVSTISLKRSLSSGRFLFSKHGRGNNAVIPV